MSGRSLMSEVGTGRTLPILLAAAAVAGFALVLAAQPYGPTLAVAAGIGLAALGFASPPVALAVALALLPMADLTDRTGMLHATESDLLVCAVIAGIASRHVLRPAFGNGAERLASGIPLLVLALMGASYAVSSLRMLSAVPAIGHGAFAGYSAPLSGLRLVKGFLLGCGLLAAARLALRAAPANTVVALRVGLAGSLGLVGLHVLWERLTFVDLTDLSTDYRVTGPFWEMHIGGAQLDGWIAFTLPMAAWWLLQARTVRAAVLPAVLTTLAAHAALVSFSRALYAAVAVETVLMVLLAIRQRATGPASPAPAGTRRWTRAVLAAAGLATLLGLAVSIFPGSGYRGMAAFLGFALLAYLVAPRLVPLPWSVTVGGAILGGIGGGTAWMLADVIPKGPYVAYGVDAIVALALLPFPGREASPRRIGLAAGAVVATGIAAVQVAFHWGGPSALPAAVVAALAGVALLPACRLLPGGMWRVGPMRPVAVLVAVCVTGIVTAGVYSNFASLRIANTPKDVQARRMHWSDGLSLLRQPTDWVVGLGPGRFREEYFWHAPPRFISGRVAWTDADNKPRLQLTGPVHLVGWGEMFRVSQRVDADIETPVTVTFRVSAQAMPAEWHGFLHLEICRKHLIYNEQCVTGGTNISSAQEEYKVRIGKTGELGPTHALGFPRPTRFAFGLDSIGGQIDILSMHVEDTAGRSLLRNGDFARGLQWWFISSDRYHLPFHAKNLWLHYLVEQGLLGFLAISIGVLMTTAWLAFGPASRHPLAPPLLAGVIGFVAIGLTDSLVDSTRLLTLWTFLSGLGLSLRPQARPASA